MVALTIGMPTYNDFDGVFFTVQALRLYQDLTDTEILVVDNFGCDHTRAFVETIGDPAVRYVRRTEITGTAPAKDRVFREALGDAVLCCDAHILFAPDAIARLKAWWRDRPGSLDLVQGPLLHDDLVTVSTHFEPVWSDEMWGTWATDPRGLDPDGKPFDIPMQGLGVFSCLREAWPGFNPLFRGFGGEEGYLQEKVRQRGGRTLCLPFLRWSHRFGRPNGVPYPLFTEHKFRNYLLGHHELGLDATPVLEHFGQRLPAAAIAEQIALAFADLGEPVPAELVPFVGPSRALPSPRDPGPLPDDALPPVPDEPPLISCVLLTYNRVPEHQWLLEEAIESFVRQDYPNAELIVLNDCGEQELVCDAPGVRVFNAPERFETLAEQWNLAVHLAEGAWIAPWNDAVISLPHRLSTSLRLLLRDGASVLAPDGAWVLDAVGLDHQRPVPAGAAHSLSLYAKALWAEVGGYPVLPEGAETAMLAEIRDAARAGGGVSEGPLPLSHWFAIVREDLPGLAFPASPDAATYARIGQAPIQPGLFVLEPRWHTDYVGLIAAQRAFARG